MRILKSVLPGTESHSIVTCRLPDGVAFDALYEAVKARGIIVYGCKGILADRFLQIANMGHMADGTIETFLGVLGEEIARLRTRTTSTPGPTVLPMKVPEERRRAG